MGADSPKANRLKIYRINEANVRWRVVDGEAVLIHVETSYYYSLNKTGTAVWELLLAGEKGLDDLVTAVSHRFAADQAVIQQDIKQLLDHLATEGLIVTNN